MNFGLVINSRSRVSICGFKCEGEILELASETKRKIRHIINILILS